MNAEKPRPTQVVVDPETVAETPLGQTPWSASGEGHEVEDEGEEREQRLVREANQHWQGQYREWKKWLEQGVSDLDSWLGEQPQPPAEKLLSVLEKVRNSLQKGAKMMEGHLPPETIQACEEGERYVM